LAFGLSLAFDFDVYLSDEATAVGDQVFRNKASKAFKDRVGRASIIMVSHSEGILRDLCQAGIWLHQGQAIWFDNINEAIENYHKSAGITRPPVKNAHKPDLPVGAPQHNPQNLAADDSSA
jgi:capsular polysaccharide transport system ATP-binding protein